MKLCLYETAFEVLRFYQGDRGKKTYWWDEEIEEDIERKRISELKKKLDKQEYKTAQTTSEETICKEK